MNRAESEKVATDTRNRARAKAMNRADALKAKAAMTKDDRDMVKDARTRSNIVLKARADRLARATFVTAQKRAQLAQPMTQPRPEPARIGRLIAPANLTGLAQELAQERRCVGESVLVEQMLAAHA